MYIRIYYGPKILVILPLSDDADASTTARQACQDYIPEWMFDPERVSYQVTPARLTRSPLAV